MDGVGSGLGVGVAGVNDTFDDSIMGGAVGFGKGEKNQIFPAHSVKGTFFEDEDLSIIWKIYQYLQ